MLFNGPELKEQVSTLLQSSSEEITIISAFIKTSVIDEMAEQFKDKNVSIYVRWQILDILRKVSDFETLYESCDRLGVRLYYNHRLHAKLVIIDQQRAFIGSSNYTQSGLGAGRDNIEWNTMLHDLSSDDYNKILFSLKDSCVVTTHVMDNFRKALSKYQDIIDFEAMEVFKPECLEGPLEYYAEFQKKLPPFEPTKLDLSLADHRDYIQSLGFLNKPATSLLITAIQNSYYGQQILEKLQSRRANREGIKILRWGDIGYLDQEFFSVNDGLYNLFLWLSMISAEYSFYRNPDYPKGTCSLNYNPTINPSKY